MRNSVKVVVEDLLERQHFQHATVIAGSKGLKNPIKWVHIMEVKEIGHLLNGNELILSTGVGWRDSEATRLNFLRQLIEKKASALCVEVGMYIDEIPQEMIDLADEHDFPIIVFTVPVRFIDITQDLNGLFIEAHYKTLLDLESVSNQFNRLLLNTDGFKRILRLLHQYINVQVVYAYVDGQMEYYPAVDKKQEAKLKEHVSEARPQNVINASTRIASKPIQAMGHKFADLIVVSKTQVLSDFDLLVLDRAATALAQDQLRQLYVEEKKKHQENRWLLEWLNGSHNKDSIEEYLTGVQPALKPNGSTVCICKMDGTEEDTDLTYFSMIFRTIFQQQGFFPMVAFERNSIIFALVNQRSKVDWKDRLSKALKQMKESELMKNQNAGSFNFGVGKLYELDRLHKSYEMAKETFFIQKKTGIYTMSFYEDLHIYRLISYFNKEKNLEEFVDDYLGKVLAYDRNKNSQMYETLKVILEVNGSKKDASERLFIVRQTLYHRMEKLKELLGEDFMQSEKRLAIEFAVHAREFLHKTDVVMTE